MAACRHVVCHLVGLGLLDHARDGICRGQETDEDEVPSLVPAREVWTVASQADGGSLVLRDDFNTGPFLGWQIVRPQPDHVSFTRNPGCLTITTQRGTIHGDEENDEISPGIKAKNLFLIQNPLSNETEASVTLHVRKFEPETFCQQVGLLFYNDDDNYLKWSLEQSAESPKLNLVLVRETKEEPQHDLITDASADGPFALRVTKRGNEYECAFSSDGENFEVAGRLPWGDGSPQYLGLLAKNGGNPRAGEIDVCIDAFEVRQMASTARVTAVPARSWRHPLLQPYAWRHPALQRTTASWTNLPRNWTRLRKRALPKCVMSPRPTPKQRRHKTWQHPARARPRAARTVDPRREMAAHA